MYKKCTNAMSGCEFNDVGWLFFLYSLSPSVCRSVLRFCCDSTFVEVACFFMLSFIMVVDVPANEYLCCKRTFSSHNPI